VGQIEVDEAFGRGEVGRPKHGSGRDPADELRVDEQADFIDETRPEQHPVQRASAVDPDGPRTETVLEGMKGAFQVDFCPSGEKIGYPLSVEAVDVALGRRRRSQGEDVPPERQAPKVDPVFNSASAVWND
jgi:hypothetical protein